ncbi:hypothetical protein P4O66_019929 [Electrophorus voltai]|uniref:Uncharacterized protein n=1 Tax=Electrophorus voltai TaxID=2609070 RepID=A0AAD8ZUU7_9TELE|nr:hypothetical protein P4O66_019929 [Electrophorus voltai]
MFYIIIFIWVVFCIDGHAIKELHLVLHSLAATLYEFYLAVLCVRRGTLLILRSLVCFYADFPQDGRNGAAQFAEGVCEACRTLPYLLGAATGLCVAGSHALKGALFLVPSTFGLLFVDDAGMERWRKERKRARKNAQVERYPSVYCYDPMTFPRLRTGKMYFQD